MNIISWSDWSQYSGFGNVARGIFTNLPSDWEIKHLGINYQPHHEIGNLPNNIDVTDARTARDIYGRKRLLKMLRHSDFDYDLIFLLQDSFVLTSRVKFEDGQYPLIQAIKTIAEQRDAKVVTYTPMDQPRPYIDWFDKCLEFSDQLVYYLDWARKNAHYYSDKDHKEEAEVIHHGVDKETFYPLNYQKRMNLRDEFGIKDDEFTILFGGANQRRKNIPHDVMGAFIKLYKQTDHNVRLLLKTEPDKSSGDGWDLTKILRQLKEDYDMPEDSMQFIGSKDSYLSEKRLNEVYNAVDAVYVPSCEGWGMFATENYATKTPVITADHASLSEIGDKNRSIQVKTSDDLEDRVWFTNDLDVYRSQVVYDSFIGNVENLIEMSDDKVNSMLDKAYESRYCRQWSEIALEWKELFEEVVNG